MVMVMEVSIFNVHDRGGDGMIVRWLPRAIAAALVVAVVVVVAAAVVYCITYLAPYCSHTTLGTCNLGVRNPPVVMVVRTNRSTQ